MRAVTSVGSLGDWLAQPWQARPTLSTFALWGYFLGTLFYVKTMIREKGEASYLRFGLGFHVLTLLAALWGSLSAGLSPLLPAFFALTTLRAALMPRLEHWRGQRTTPKQVGLTEFGLSLVLLVTLSLG